MNYDVWVDFTDVGPDGHVFALKRHARRPVGVGDVVIVGDGEDAFAEATVVGFTPSGWIDLRIQPTGFWKERPDGQRQEG